MEHKSQYYDSKAAEAGVLDPSPEYGDMSGMGQTIKRDLRRRHINMIALAGMIGTGLFLASGQAIALAGPVGALLGYIVMGFITCGVALCTGELSAFMPITGGFVRHASYFVQPALGMATGWNFWYTMAITAPAELSAAATIIDFWDTTTNQAVWFSVFIVVIAVLNFSGVRWYGESEVVFAFLKITLIIGLIIAGIVVDLGGGPDHDRIGFRYWKNPGPMNTYLVYGDKNTGRFLAFWSTLISASYSYANVQVVALAGSETRNPRSLIPNAIKMTFWRVAIFYILSLFVVGLLVPYNDPNLGISTGNAQQSPFVIAFQRAGINVLPSIINAVVCTSAFSCGSACIFLASRTLYGLAEERQAPRIFLRVNRFGTPWVAVLGSLIFLPLVYLSLGSNSSVVFGWFVNITSVAGLIGWVVIQVSFLRFYYAMKYQGISRNRLPYKSPLQPYMAWTTLGALILVVLFCGYSVFFPGNWSTSAFITYYIDIAIFIFLWAVAWLFYRTKPLKLSQIDLSEIEQIEREKELEQVERDLRSWWRLYII
ncbi:amino acid permease [Exophiala viscosa]|uniref:amino acid permease n=1 Tax=Exophiala viscosa TaxID=2486360 RepID=UPI00218F810E|nr:amino acid permease [Exophiala viscosa]